MIVGVRPYEPLNHAVAAIEAARAEDNKRRSRYRAQLWETARRSTAAALRDVLQDKDLWGSVEPVQRATRQASSMEDALGRLDRLQLLVTGELLILLHQTGYRPPPQPGRLVSDLENAVAAAARKPDRVSVAQARGAVEHVLGRIEELEGKSAKRVRRELSPLRRRLVYAALAVQVVMAPAYTGAASEVGKSFARQQLQELGLAGGQQPTGPATAGAGRDEDSGSISNPSNKGPRVRARQPG